MRVLLPGATIGILGGGQLARMMSLEARRLGYRTVVLDPDTDGPGGQVADARVSGTLDDWEAASRLAGQCDVVTLDTEHVPAEVLAHLEQTSLVRPSAAVLATVQDRLAQRRFLDAQGIPQVRYAVVDDVSSLNKGAHAVGYPLVLKTRRWGYDGRGQVRVEDQAALVAAWEEVHRAPSVMEAFVDFEREISVLLARGLDGGMCFYPVAENAHRRHILHTTRVPARIPELLMREAREIAGAVANGLEHVGMMAVELFVTQKGGLLVNEIAPRTHNSGHFTFGACVTSQFEQHIRAVCGLPLGDPSLLRSCAMLNVLGDTWQYGVPDWRHVFAHSNASLHLYGKRKATPGRKMGHILVVDDEGDRAADTAETIAAVLECGEESEAGERAWMC